MKSLEYRDFQEKLAFEKELNILRNDFYYKLIDSDGITLVDFMYFPLDIVSGDIYTARRISKNKILYLLVDGMGKGLSASLTSMIITAFINHYIDKMVAGDEYKLETLIHEAIEFIRPILLEEEALAIDFICFDAHTYTLDYAKFAMPFALLQTQTGEVIKLKSNNPPLSKWTRSFEIDTYDVSNIKKFLFVSDGITEGKMKDGRLYAQEIEKDFQSSFTREEFKEKLFAKLGDIEDDLTLIFLNRLELYEKNMLVECSFGTSLEDVEKANQWYMEMLAKYVTNESFVEKGGLVFNELFMNAYEHGNLGIENHLKHQMLEQDTYIEKLLELEKNCTKKINIKLYEIKNNDSYYIVTEITDEGDGFDTQLLSTIFRNAQMFNGRGVFVSRKNSLGIYYNTKGNRVLFLNKV